MMKIHFKYFLVLCLIGAGSLSSRGVHAGAWANYNAKIAPLFEAENERLNRVHPPLEETELGFTVELKQSGAVRQVKIITSSGSEELDAIVIQSAFDLSPLPTPPASVFFRQFFTPLTFRYKFNRGNLADAPTARNAVEQQQGIDEEKRENSEDRPNRTKQKRSDLVASLQTELAQAGFDPGPVDGYFGRRTEAAIRSFQRQSGVIVDGRPSNDLLLLLNDYKNSKELSDSTSAGTESDVAGNSNSNLPDEPENRRLSKRVYEDYEYIDPSIPRVYEDYEYIEQ